MLYSRNSIIQLLVFVCVGSGKSYTMMGANLGQEDHSKGLIPRICDALFEKIAEVSGGRSRDLSNQSDHLCDQLPEHCHG